MGVSLCVFDGDIADDETDTLGSCDVGHLGDFEFFRDTIARLLGTEAYPMLLQRLEWSVEEIPQLMLELRTIGAAFRNLPPSHPVGAFELTAKYRVDARSLYDCFHDLRGDNLFESLLRLCEIAERHRRPITFFM